MGKPVFNTVADAVEKEGANTSVIFVPPPFAADAILESAMAGIEVVICITEGIPARDMVSVFHYCQQEGVKLIASNGAVDPYG